MRLKYPIIFLFLCIFTFQSEAQLFTKERLLNNENFDKAPLSYGYFLGLNAYDFNIDYNKNVKDIALTYQIYGGFDLGWAFHLKLLGASLLLIVICFLNIHLSNSAKKGVPPNPKITKIVPMIARPSLALALIGVAILTTS